MKILFIFLSVFLLIVVFDSTKLIFYYSKFKKLTDIKHNNLEIGKGKVIIYVAAGDSTAVGKGASSLESTYTYKVFESLERKGEVSYSNIAVSGATSADLIYSQLDKIESLEPDIVTISIGANDLTHLIDEEKIFNNFKMIKERLEKNTSATIYIANIPDLTNAKLLPFWYRELIDTKAVRINNLLKTLGSERFKVVNIHDEIPHGPETFAEDYFHPSDTGYKNWAKAFIDKVF